MTATTIEAPTFADAAELLDAAAEHLIQVGWNRGDLFYEHAGNPYTAPCCMIGAVRAAARVPADVIEADHPHQPPLVREAEEILAQQVLLTSGKAVYDGDDLDPVETVADWNDADNCDADSAIEMLRDAAELAR